MAECRCETVTIFAVSIVFLLAVYYSLLARVELLFA